MYFKEDEKISYKQLLWTFLWQEECPYKTWFVVEPEYIYSIVLHISKKQSGRFTYEVYSELIIRKGADLLCS